MAAILQSAANGVKEAVTETIREVCYIITSSGKVIWKTLNDQISFSISVHRFGKRSEGRMHSRNITLQAILGYRTKKLA